MKYVTRLAAKYIGYQFTSFYVLKVELIICYSTLYKVRNVIGRNKYRRIFTSYGTIIISANLS